jgi:hypothetical protein
MSKTKSLLDDERSGDASFERTPTGWRTLTEAFAGPPSRAFRTLSMKLFDEDAFTTNLVHAYGDVADQGPQVCNNLLRLVYTTQYLRHLTIQS